MRVVVMPIEMSLFAPMTTIGRQVCGAVDVPQ
jgi:hypothetical protein